MFESGKIYKVKVEISPGKMGFGRMNIIEKLGNQLLGQLKTSKGSNQVLPKGAPIWFVDDSPNNAFNGLWQSTVFGAQIHQGQTVMVVNAPKFEPAAQRRRAPRVPLDAAIEMMVGDETIKHLNFRSRDISRSGIAIETHELAEIVDQLEIRSEIPLLIHSNLGDFVATSRIIRVEHNWLANKTLIGLEFSRLTPEATAILDRLLTFLGAKPRGAAEDDKQVQGKQLADWIPETKTDTSFVRREENQE